MMRRTSLVHRIQRVEGIQRHVDVTTLAQKLAETEGCSAQELIAEAERIVAACHQQGITSTEGMVRDVAQELGITAEELDAEMTRYRELMG